MICLHHTGDTSEEPQYEKVSAYHNRGAGGKFPPNHGIQYGAFIERTGEILYKDIPLPRTWHAGSKEWNDKSRGVCLAGDFRIHTPTKEQLDSLFEIWKNHNFPPILYHKDVKQTACPGTFPFLEALDVRRLSHLEKKLKIAEKALGRVTGLRLMVLLRWIDRVRHLLRV